MEKMGPSPADWSRDAPNLSAGRAAVLQRLRQQSGQVSVSDLADWMSLHTNTVRGHLDALVEVGLATRQAERPHGRGRPAWLYTAVDPAALDVRAKDYSALAAALAGHIARSSAQPGADALLAGQEWGRELATDRRLPRSSQPAVRREVVALLGELGFAPMAGRDATVVRLRQCPLLDAATRYPEVVCSAHLGLVRGAMSEMGGHADRTSLSAFAEPGACVLRMNSTDGG
jgi:predicted ArsR family transcriptional regulator